MADDMQDDDLISQDDIDALLESSGMSGDDTPDSGLSDDDMGELSQDDIDSLLNSNALEPETVSENAGPEDDVDDDGMELISQDDIDQLMNNDGGDPLSDTQEFVGSEPDQDPIEDDEADEDFSELISQDDISDLLSSGDETEPVIDSQPDPDTGEGDEVDLSIGDEFDLPEPDQPQIDSDDIIDESQAVDVQDCLINQGDLDAMLDNHTPPDAGDIDEEAPHPPNPDPVQETELNTDFDIVDLDLDADEIGEDLDLDPSPVPDPDPPASVEDEISQDDIDDLLNGADDGEDVSQEDIDALLTDAGDMDKEDDDDILISQDDIDSLLMASDQEDEDILGNLTDEDEDDIFDESLGDLTEDLLDSDDDDFEAGDEDQVLLEGDEEDDEGPSLDKEKSGKWYKSKLVLACAGVGLLMAVLLPVVYFLFLSPDNDNSSAQMTQAPETMTTREVIVETVDVTIDQGGVTSSTPAAVSGGSGNMELKGFLVLAPDDSKDLSYVAADISIDYADKRAYDEISENMPFYRGLIYESIQKILISDKRNDITESDMINVVEAALKKVLPGQYINTIRFDSFKAG